MDQEFKFGLTEKDMKVNGSIMLPKEKEEYGFLMETLLKEYFQII